jgi:hypothetical protein
MTLRKIADIPEPCRNPQHDPPSMICLSPGVYEHTCPGCGARVLFTVPWVSCHVQPMANYMRPRHSGDWMDS